MKANRKNNNDTIRQTGNLVFAIAQILGGAFTEITGIGTSIQSQSAGSETPVIPAGYAFSIWGPIFLLSLIYAVYQALPSQRENKLFRSIGFFTAIAFLANTVWEIVAQVVTFNWPTAIIIVVGLVSSLLALFRLTEFKGKITKFQKTIAYLPVSMLAGWVSAATFANISSVAKQLNYHPFGLSESILSLIILAAAAFLAVAVIVKTKGNYLYTLTIIWALSAILVANLNRVYNPLIAGAAFLLLVVIITTLFWVKNKSTL